MPPLFSAHTLRAASTCLCAFEGARSINSRSSPQGSIFSRLHAGPSSQFRIAPRTRPGPPPHPSPCAHHILTSQLYLDLRSGSASMSTLVRRVFKRKHPSPYCFIQNANAREAHPPGSRGDTAPHLLE
ncbi:hypothetical protein FA95DRAFT_1609323 [Auriscalpium vulgare]|uniref:Uncharacterized protein n=1 Tax=Auriscalpium vulgare TaxID=40419 RepID=A0ACB8RHG6_9AGAM|nr:hypothetical protein FA95DRAFT_1609323 [Auriscalpium vulgare]